MKKLILVSIVVFTLILPSFHFLQPIEAVSYKPTSEIQMVVNYPIMTIDGINLEIDPGRSTSPVIIKEWGRTVVPVRSIIEAIGGSVSWNSQSKKVSIELNGTKVELTIGSAIAIVNGKEAWIDENHSVKPIIINSRTMIPIRFVVESLGGTVEYDEKTMKIKMTLEKQLFNTKDMLGTATSIPKKIYKLVSLDSMLTQYLFTINAQDLLISARFGTAIKGPALAKIYPRSLKLVDPGSSDTVNVEYLLSLKPDLVISNDGKMVEKIREVGIPVYVFDKESPDKIMNCIAVLGELLGRAEKAKEINSYFKGKLSYIKEKTSSYSENNKVKVYVSGSKLFGTFGKDYFQTFMIENAGGISVSSTISGGKIDISLEQLLKWNPDVIILTAYTPDSVKDVLSNSSLLTLKAVKEKKVYKLPTYIVSWDTPAPESFLGTMWIANKIYPQELAFDIEKEIKEFYLKVYNYRIPQEDLIKLIE